MIILKNKYLVLNEKHLEELIKEYGELAIKKAIEEKVILKLNNNLWTHLKT